MAERNQLSPPLLAKVLHALFLLAGGLCLLHLCWVYRWICQSKCGGFSLYSAIFVLGGITDYSPCLLGYCISLCLYGKSSAPLLCFDSAFCCFWEPVHLAQLVANSCPRSRLVDSLVGCYFCFFGLSVCTVISADCQRCRWPDRAGARYCQKHCWFPKVSCHLPISCPIQLCSWEQVIAEAQCVKKSCPFSREKERPLSRVPWCLFAMTHVRVWKCLVTALMYLRRGAQPMYIVWCMLCHFCIFLVSLLLQLFAKCSSLRVCPCLYETDQSPSSKSHFSTFHIKWLIVVFVFLTGAAFSSIINLVFVIWFVTFVLVLFSGKLDPFLQCSHSWISLLVICSCWLF